MSKENKSVVVVLGAGRSGTSLCTRMLSNYGVSLSNDLVGPSDSNKYGAYEDKHILSISRELLKIFNRAGPAFSYVPMPSDWMKSKLLEASRTQLESIVSFETDSNKLWGFKEPVTSKLLPLWHVIFDRLNIKPIYILCIRHPASVVASFEKAYKTDSKDAELVWLSRYVDAIQHTNGDVTVIPFESWFDEPEVNTHKINVALRQTSLGGMEGQENDSSSGFEDIDASVVIPQDKVSSAVSEETLYFYRALMRYGEQKISKEDVILASQKAHEYLMNEIYEQQIRKLQKLNGINKSLKDKNKTLDLKVNELMREQEEIKQDNLDSWRKHKTTRSYRLAMVFANVRKKPIRNGVLFPIDFLKVLFMSKKKK